MAKILIAEDDASMRNFIAMALEKDGHEATQCADGVAAFAKIESGDSYDILLADIIMPGMDGIELSKRATAIDPALKVMFITGFAGIAQDKTDQDRKVISKPFHLNDLVTQVNELLAA